MDFNSVRLRIIKGFFGNEEGMDSINLIGDGLIFRDGLLVERNKSIANGRKFE